MTFHGHEIFVTATFTATEGDRCVLNERLNSTDKCSVTVNCELGVNPSPLSSSLTLTQSYGPWKLPWELLYLYDLYGPVLNVFDASRSITRASGRGLGPGNLDFFGLHGTRLTARLDAISQSPKVSISRAKPPLICPRNESARIKHITYGAVKIINNTAAFTGLQ